MSSIGIYGYIFFMLELGGFRLSFKLLKTKAPKLFHSYVLTEAFSSTLNHNLCTFVVKNVGVLLRSHRLALNIFWRQ